MTQEPVDILCCSCGCTDFVLFREGQVQCADCGFRPDAAWHFTSDRHLPEGSPSWKEGIEWN